MSILRVIINVTPMGIAFVLHDGRKTLFPSHKVEALIYFSVTGFLSPLSSSVGVIGGIKKHTKLDLDMASPISSIILKSVGCKILILALVFYILSVGVMA